MSNKKNSLPIILKNFLDLAVGVIVYYAVGWAWAFGSQGNGFIGNGEYFLLSLADSRSIEWFFQFTFCTAACTIVSGCLAERIQFQGYLVYAVLFQGWVQPVLAHWLWSPQGWLSPFTDPTALFLGVGGEHFS